MVITANGEVQTNEEATVYVKELDILLTMKVLEDTPAVLKLGKLCDEHGHPYEWINGQKPHLILNSIRIQRNTENFVPIVVPGLSTSSSSSLPSSPPMIPLRQEIDHSKSSSSLSTSTPMTSSTEIDQHTGKKGASTVSFMCVCCRARCPRILGAGMRIGANRKIVSGREISKMWPECAAWPASSRCSDDHSADTRLVFFAEHCFP